MRRIGSGLSAIIGIGPLVGPRVSVAAQDGATAPVSFTGKLLVSSCTGEREPIREDRRTRNIRASGGRYCEPTVVEPFSGLRLQGEDYVWQNNDEYVAGPTVFALGISIVTDEDAWHGVPGSHHGEYGSGEHLLVGESEYDGLTAIAKVDLDGREWTWQGWIIDADLTPLPTEPEAIP